MAPVTGAFNILQNKLYAFFGPRYHFGVLKCIFAATMEFTREFFVLCASAVMRKTT
jgi:hypothetical protein